MPRRDQWNVLPCPLMLLLSLLLWIRRKRHRGEEGWKDDQTWRNVACCSQQTNQGAMACLSLAQFGFKMAKCVLLQP